MGRSTGGVSRERNADKKLGYDVWDNTEKDAANEERKEGTDSKAKKEAANGMPILVYPHTGWSDRRKLLDGPFDTAANIIYGLALRGANRNRIARFFGVPEAFIKENFEDVIDQATAELEIKLIDTQMYLALERRNPVILMWLSKNYLGFTDRPAAETITDSSGTTFEVKLVQATVQEPDEQYASEAA